MYFWKKTKRNQGRGLRRGLGIFLQQNPVARPGRYNTIHLQTPKGILFSKKPSAIVPLSLKLDQSFQTLVLIEFFVLYHILRPPPWDLLVAFFLRLSLL